MKDIKDNIYYYIYYKILECLLCVYLLCVFLFDLDYWSKFV